MVRSLRPWVPDISLTQGTSPRAGAKFRHDSEHVRAETALAKGRGGFGRPSGCLTRYPVYMVIQALALIALLPFAQIALWLPSVVR